MRLEKLVALGVMWISAGIPACGGSVDASTEGGSGGGSSGGAAVAETGGGGAGGGTSGGGGLPQGFCAEACASAADGSCFPAADCTAHCDANAPGWSPEIGAAFATCAKDHPLCFESVEGCILSELHPPGTKHTVRVEGAGFDEHDGKLLKIWHDPDSAAPFQGEVVLAGGQLSFEWEAPIFVTDVGGPLLLLYIDIDGDQECVAAADITGSVNPEWNGDLLDPVYTAVLAPPLADADFVCDFTP